MKVRQNYIFVGSCLKLPFWVPREFLDRAILFGPSMDLHFCVPRQNRAVRSLDTANLLGPLMELQCCVPKESCVIGTVDRAKLLCP